MRIVDPAGKWFVNSAQFAFNDPESNTRFEPHEPTKATPTTWIEGQPTINEVEDPVEAAEKAAAETKLAEEAQAAAKVEADAKAAAEAVAAEKAAAEAEKKAAHKK